MKRTVKTTETFDEEGRMVERVVEEVFDETPTYSYYYTYPSIPWPYTTFIVSNPQVTYTTTSGTLGASGSSTGWVGYNGNNYSIGWDDGLAGSGV